ncbi:uncharacterized protein [Channa argus]
MCHFSSSGSWKFFCKEECSEGGILVKAESDTANNGRYSFEYKSGSSGKMFLHVTIRNMIQSDSGQYKFGVGKSSGPDSYCEYEARVSDELDKNTGFIRTNVEGETLSKPCYDEVNRSRFFFCKDDCKKQEDVLIETDQKKAQSGRYGVEYIDGSAYGLYVTITQVKKSDSGQYKCGYGRALSPDSSKTFSLIVIEAPTTLEPTQTVRPSSTTQTQSPTTLETTQTLRPSSTTQTQSFSDVPHQGSVLPLVVCVPLVGVSLLVVSLLVLYKRRTRRNMLRNTTEGTNKELSVIYENWDSVPTCEDNIYQNFDPTKTDKH